MTKCVTCLACRTDHSVTNSISSKDIFFWKFVELCEMCCRACCILSNIDCNVLQYSEHWVERFLISLWGDKIPLNWYGLWNTSCLLRIPKPFPSNFKAVFSNSNRLRAVNDVTVLLADRCHVGHINANRLHAHGSACTLVATTQDGAFGYVRGATDERARAYTRVHEIGVYVPYVTATDW
jgi:hypothetical protein